MTNSTKNDQITKFLESLSIGIDLCQYLDLDKITDYDSISEMLEDNGAFNVEVIYYSRAMKYLMENDTSLTESLQLAHNMGFEAKDINSELLASLLQSEEVRREWYDLEDEVQEFLDSIEEEN